MVELHYGLLHADVLDFVKAGLCAGLVRFYAGKDGVRFGWVMVKTIARWSVGK